MNELQALQDKESGAATAGSVRTGSVAGAGDDRPAGRERERRRGGFEQRPNALRAGVLGANDGIVSTAAVVVGVAGATTPTGAIATAGVAAAIGGGGSLERGG